MKTTAQSRRVFLGIAFFLVWSATRLYAQITISINPANRQEARLLLTNPAAATIAPRAYLGYKLIYPGAIPRNTFALKASYLTLSLPHVGGSRFGVGLAGRYFNTPLFQEGKFGLQAAYALSERLAVGADLSLLFKSYAKENFDLVDIDDPVFRNGNSLIAFDPGFGLLAQLYENFTFAATFLHLTQPNVALGEAESKLPLESLFGLRFSPGSFRFDLGAHLWQKQMYPMLGAEIFSTRSGRFRLGYGLENISFEGQLQLRGTASLFYSFNLPTSNLGVISAGSHEAGFVYAFASPQ